MIREIKNEDFDDVLRLISILEEKEYDREKMSRVYNRHLNDEDYHCFVYVLDKKVVGMISLLIKETLHHCGKTGEIIELCVDPTYRNNSIGKKLLDYVEDKAIHLQLSELELSSNIKRKDAHRFYERHQYNKDHFNFTKKINH